MIGTPPPAVIPVASARVDVTSIYLDVGTHTRRLTLGKPMINITLHDIELRLGINRLQLIIRFALVHCRLFTASSHSEVHFNADFNAHFNLLLKLY